MLKRFFLLLSLFLFLCSASSSFAAPSFVSVVNPVRGGEFWDLENEKPKDAVLGQLEISARYKTPFTWLLRFDALEEQSIVNLLKKEDNQEKGLLLEITPNWAKAASVNYRNSPSWHFAGSVFLTGYEVKDREKLIDAAFNKFKDTFGFFPESVGAWYIDSYSLDYMEEKYGISGALIVADQYTTDNYQIWGQYWSAPYYPSKTHTLLPAQNKENKLPLVVTQWASRDPINGYGDGVQESTYSVQVNDYIDYHSLDDKYFAKLVDLFTKQDFNQVNQLTIGLENSYSWKKYKDEYRKQLDILIEKKNQGQLSLVTMSNFSGWYKKNFPDFSPAHIIITDDPLGGDNKSIWFMNPYYRAGWFYNKEGSLFRDIRPYNDGQKEFCYSVPCEKLNFASFALRVLDDVTYKQKLNLDMGKISNIKVTKVVDGYLISYKNESDKERNITFMDRDIKIDEKISSIDGIILGAVSSQINSSKQKIDQPVEKIKIYQETLPGFTFKIIKFILFIVFALFIPGYLLIRFFKQTFPLNIFLSIPLGFTLLTLFSYLSGYIRADWLIFIYLGICWTIFLIKGYYQELVLKQIFRLNTETAIVGLGILFGTIFQSLAMIKSGWVYDFGVGFLGPTGHDGIWHQALIGQLIQKVPPENPIFSEQVLTNYHYFYDLLVAVTSKISQIPVLDLLYRFYPVLFSLLLGLGTYLLVKRLTGSKQVSLISLYFVYFAGSFGWIVEFIRERHFGGESAFWINQPVSMNLNPPFAISLILLIMVIFMVSIFKDIKNYYIIASLIITVGTLIEFKVYAAVVIFLGLGIISLLSILKKKDFSYTLILIGSLILTALLFIPQNQGASDLLVFSPFWFVHSMVDFTDRVGWERLSLARQVGWESGFWFKYIAAEIIGLILFIIGNLGVRFIALFSLFAFLKKKRYLQIEYAFIVSTAMAAIIIPLLFIQKGNPWNTIQFSYYFLYLVAIFTGSVFLYLYKYLPRVVALIILFIFLLIAPINAIVTFRSSFEGFPPARLTLGEMEGLEFLKNQPQGVVLTPSFDRSLKGKLDAPFPLVSYETTAYVSAFSEKPTFLEDEIQQEILQTGYKKRLVEVNDFFKGRDYEWSKDFLLRNNIRYIYIPKLSDASLNIEELKLKNIFKNSEVEIFKVKYY